MVIRVHTIYEVRASLYHTLVDKFLIRFFLAAHSAVVKELIPEATVNQMARSMLGSTYVEVYILPVFIGFLAHECLVVLRIHVAKIVGRTACKARHGVEFEGEDGLVVHKTLVCNLLLGFVPGPFLGASQWRFSCFGGFVFVNFGKLEWQTFFGNHIGHAILVVDRERLSPIALA